MNQTDLPTLEDLRSAVKVLGYQEEFAEEFVPTLRFWKDAKEEAEAKKDRIITLMAREARFRDAVALLVAGCTSFFQEFGLTIEDCIWVEDHARDARPGTFPEGCAGRFKAARIALKT